MKKEKVTLFIISHSYGKYLANAIDSALKQTFPCEVIVFDNASTDTTKKVISKYDNITKLSTDKFVEWKPLLNKLISEQGGEYILILGADDTIEPTFVEKSMQKMTKDVGIVRTGLRAFGSREWLDIPQAELTTVEEELENLIPFTSLFRKKAWADAAGYDEKVPSYEDWDLWIRIMQAGWKVADVREPLFNYMVHYDSGYYQVLKDDAHIRDYIYKKCVKHYKDLGSLDRWLVERKLAEAQKELILLKQEIEEKDYVIADREKAIKEKVSELDKIQNSTTWKTGMIIRRIYKTFVRTKDLENE